MNKNKYIGKQRLRRKRHVRNKTRGNAEHPRLCVYRSHKNIGAQIIDDETGKTLVSANTQQADVKAQIPYGGNCDAAKQLGTLLAKRAMDAGIQRVRFDRGPARYHGRVAALADALREAGLGL